MRALRQRLRPDNIPSEERAARGSTGRIVYLILLGIFTFAILNFFFGDYFLFRADGLVLRQRSVVATTYIARVDSIDVRQGQAVEQGTQLLKLQSMEIVERLVDLSMKRADLIAKATDFKIRTEVLTALLPLAKSFDAKAETVIKEFDTAAAQGFVPNSRYADAMRLQFDTRRKYLRLTAESRVLKDGMAAVEAALADANTSFTDLKTVYSNGLVRAPVSGTIGPSVPSVGDVYRPGDPLLTVYFGEPYILLYLPRRYLFPVYPGMKLEVTDGQNTATGVILEILPVTDALPKEFQNTYKPSDRNQLAKIKLEPSTTVFPLLQKVHVSIPYSTLCGEGCCGMLGTAGNWLRRMYAAAGDYAGMAISGVFKYIGLAAEVMK